MHEMNLSAVDLNLLVVLDALLSEAHVRRAGERVGLSQPATSHALARLRALLDDPLLVRTGATMTLTPKAERLRVPLTEVLESTRLLLSDTRFEAHTSRRTFTFMMPDVVCDLLGPPLVERVAAAAPGIRLAFSPWRGPDLLSPRDLREIDFIVTSVERDFPGFADEMLYEDTDVVVARAQHPAGRRLSTQSGFRAARHVAVVGTGESEDVSEEWLRAVGLERVVALSVPTYLLALRIVSRTDLVAFVPRKLTASMTGGLGLAIMRPPVDPGADRMLLRTSQRLVNDPATHWMRDMLRAVVAERADQP